MILLLSGEPPSSNRCSTCWEWTF